MEMSGQIHVPATLPAMNDFPVTYLSKTLNNGILQTIGHFVAQLPRER
jgi:hypothetical protein